ncbi:hypothetical protein BC936DRAFT_137573 [Jimgerdemannia flammicorona]|uniref:Uncharacterized protein n=1 Tax=Jimgerdemannia flammicorona TaxID=994334 RepID=A0A433CX17_9FUNG|nr:hypothetical protein BC936DRAFT_137573 [Jimgerdemannia flammicorona]
METPSVSSPHKKRGKKPAQAFPKPISLSENERTTVWPPVTIMIRLPNIPGRAVETAAIFENLATLKVLRYASTLLEKYAASYNHKRLPLARTSKIPSAHGPRRPNLAQYLIDGLIVFKVNSGHPSRPHHISRRFVGLSKLCFIPPIRFCIRLLMSDFCVHVIAE